MCGEKNSMAYSEKELKDLKETADKLGLKDVELGYGKCLKNGELQDTELEEENVDLGGLFID